MGKIRTGQGIKGRRPLTALIHSKKHWVLVGEDSDPIRRMAQVGSLTIDVKPVKHPNSASAFLSELEIQVPLEGLVDPAAMRKERDFLVEYIGSLEAKIANEAFRVKAPACVVEEIRAKLASEKEKLSKIEEHWLGGTAGD